LPALPRVEIDTKDKTFEQILGNLTKNIYNLEADHFRMAELLQIHPEQRPLEFDRLRKHYPIRREFHNTKIKLVNGPPELQRKIAGLGFKVKV
jgi:erythronate-4-phosphate dehydrogenase